MYTLNGDGITIIESGMVLYRVDTPPTLTKHHIHFHCCYMLYATAESRKSSARLTFNETEIYNTIFQFFFYL